MYEHFFGLNENPFANTADPDAHYVNHDTREAMAALAHGKDVGQEIRLVTDARPPRASEL